jgi:hypothetical protein
MKYFVSVVTGAREILKKTGNNTRKAFNKFSTKDYSCAGNITHDMGNTTILKPE